MKRSSAVALFAVALSGNAIFTRGATAATPLPASDPNNTGGWVFNEAISDEFTGTRIDRKKWFVQGENGRYYIWKGRPPSQFTPHNVLQEDGKLKIRTQWEPDYPFAKESYADGSRNDTYGVWNGKPLPVTTGGVISRKRFLYGYMEVRSKAGNAAMTSSFWSIGYESELDIHEHMGRPKIKGDITAKTWKASVHDWSPPAKRPTRRFGFKTNLPFRVADEFHVYGCEWGAGDLKLFLDGKLVYETTREQQGKNWVLNNPLEIWFDSEIFVWLGLPHQDELPVDYQIDYLRVWQKPTQNLLAPQFFGFEGPMLFEDHPKPLDLVPESSEVQEYQKFWEIGEHGLTVFSIVKDQAARGLKSLKLDPRGLQGNVAVVTPAQAVDLPAGKFELSMQVMREKGCGVQALHLSLADPEVFLKPYDLSGIREGHWVTLKQPFKRNVASGPHDRLRIRIKKDEVKDSPGALFIDDIAIVPVKR